MVVVLEKNISESDKNKIRSFLETKGFQIREIVGEFDTIFGAVGSVSIDKREVELLKGVEKVVPIHKPYKLASRELQKEDTIISIGPVKIGGNRIVVIAGPCAVESREQIIESAIAAKEAGAVMLRGGAFKPRTSPYSFQGLGKEGLIYLKEASELTGLPVVTEVVSPGDVEMMKDYIDVYQIGARNMQNFELLKTVGSMDMPVILKRGMAATIEEWLMAAEYLLASGTSKVILCERGIRTYEPMTRNTLDLSAIPIVKKLSHLPVIVDPSHATGLRNKVLPMALAGVAAGAHGLIIEMHPDPDNALSDGPQSLYPEQLEKLICDIEALSPVLGKELARIPHTNEKLIVENNLKATGNLPKAGFQGIPGAYSEKAVFLYFHDDAVTSVPCDSFKHVFDNVLKGDVQWGVVPIENSLAGSILENYDLLSLNPDIKIVGEVKVRIRHNLISKEGVSLKDLTTVYSHPQALAQCAEFLKKNHLEPVPYYDTAGAVSNLNKFDKSSAAIGSAEAADIYGMSIIKEGIETNPNNYTRFFIIVREDFMTVEKPSKASFILTVSDEPGALSQCLSIFSDHSLNMTKLESRPIHGKPWSYRFYIDVQIPEDRNQYEEALDVIKDKATDFRVLGEY
ncbi:MAG: 3-deoxy-7-phosphoheptulonate synthase [Spirochaetaceae bacterium]|jgi:3-deoxy-7-phosphoheptulonate synthase|nr:3-deoxy-7-phosphoheptulonate synthase [Spirochaetaceae bacterium]